MADVVCSRHLLDILRYLLSRRH